jgi:hypothetical protein
VPKIVGLLHAQLNFGAIAEQLAEAYGDSRRYALAPAQNVIERLAGDAQLLRDLDLGLAARWNDDLGE